MFLLHFKKNDCIIKAITLSGKDLGFLPFSRLEAA